MFDIVPDNIIIANMLAYLVIGMSLMLVFLYGCISRYALKRSLGDIEQIPKYNPNPVICINLKGKLIFSNPAATEKFPDIEEKTFSHPILSDLDELKDAILKEPEETHTSKREINYRGFFYEQHISAVTRNNEKLLIIYCYDTTMHKIFEKQLQISKDAADVANRAKSDFLANISHELRTPMNGIIGLSQLLIETLAEEEQKELASAVNTSSRNLLILLNDILDLSKIEAGELTLERIPFDVRRAIQQTVDLLKPVASRKSVILDSVISPIIKDRIIGDPARLQQILNNLISNAIKFTEDGYVRIDVTTGRDKNDNPELHIYVEDTGIGIPEDKRDLIFQKFTQADVSTARRYGGTGLGLSITKELVHKMGGTIGVDSVVGKGTTFFVKIPVEIAKNTEEDSLSEKDTTNVAINTDARVLVVDDHPINLLFMRKVLKKLGFKNAAEASGGKQAVEMTKENNYDLIFMDCQMPDMDGFEASTIIRENEEKIGDIKIVAVTADAMKGAREKCIDSGMNDYISKPVDVEKLNDILSLWLPTNEQTSTKPETASPSPTDDNDNESDSSTDTKSEKDMILEMMNDIDNEKDDDTTANDNNDDTSIMDWERLDLFTDGDPEEEKALIDLFITNAEETIESIKQQIDSQDNEEWKKAVHRLKGSAANLGAVNLSEICKEAEAAYEKNSETKRIFFQSITASYDEVHKELHKKIS